MRSLVMVAALAALGMGGPAAAAGEEGDEGRLDRRISVVFKALSFRKCLEQLSEKAGVNVIAEQEVIRRMGEKPVTLALKDVPVWTVMHLFARSCRLQLSYDDRAFILEEPTEPDEVWAKLKLEVDDGEIEIRVLRADVPAELKREVVWRVLHERLGEREREEEEDDRPEGDEGEPGEGEQPEKPAKPKAGELF